MRNIKDQTNSEIITEILRLQEEWVELGEDLHFRTGVGRYEDEEYEEWLERKTRLSTEYSVLHEELTLRAKGE